MQAETILPYDMNAVNYGDQYLPSKFKNPQSYQIQSADSQLKSSRASTSELLFPQQAEQRAQLKELADDSENFGEVLRLAYVSGSQQVHIDEQSLYFLQKYSTFEVSFIGLVGSKETGKSFILDSILNLSCSQGNQFTTVYGSPREKGIYLWTIPFCHNSKLKIFLLQCSGIDFQGVEHQREDTIIIDLMNVLCSSVVVVTPPEPRKKRKNPIFEKDSNSENPVEGNLIEELTKSARRILNGTTQSTKDDQYWPHSVYYLHHRKNGKKNIEQLQKIYKYCNYDYLPEPFCNEDQTKEELLLSFNNGMLGLNPLFVKNISRIFIEIIIRTSTKQYMNLKYTGNICCKLLINTIKYLNKKPKIKINKIFNSILKELYQSSFAYHTEIYDDYLKEYFSNEEPLPYDHVIAAFKISSEACLKSFNQIIINETAHQEYQAKLLEYIEEKEMLIIDINSKKTKNILKERVKSLQTLKNYDINSVKDFIRTLNGIERHLDHNRSYMIADKLLRYTKNLEKRYVQEKLEYQKQVIKQLTEKIEENETQYNETKKTNEQNRRINRQNEKQYKKLVKQSTANDGTVKSLKKEIDIEKKYQKEYIVNKESKKEHAENLLELLREYEEKIRDNQKVISDINKEFEYHPDILALNKKLEEKERQIKDLDRMESRIDLGSKASVIRSAIQKPKEVKTSVKRLSSKKPA